MFGRPMHRELGLTLRMQCEEYNKNVLRKEANGFLASIATCTNLETARERMRQHVTAIYYDAFGDDPCPPAQTLIRLRDCANALMSVLSSRSDDRAGFSVAQALWDIASDRPRPDLKPGFYAELIHWIRGLMGKSELHYIGPEPVEVAPDVTGREAAIVRSEELDKLWNVVESQMGKYATGLDAEARQRRENRKRKVMSVLNASEDDWDNWQWQAQNFVADADSLSKLIPLTDKEYETIQKARQGCLPLGITPYYLSLMDEERQGRDTALRMQVLPPSDYVERMLDYRRNREHSFDFMLESDTSPIDLVTRRYPAIVILKPYNTCPQICVYCQRNWEIDQAMAPEALAEESKINAAVEWIDKHPAVREVLITGGDPLMLDDGALSNLVSKVAGIDHVDMIRIGTRTPVTMPMRITEKLAETLGQFRDLGKRDVALVTHFEHVYEITPDVVQAIDRLRRQGISVYNQHVYTMYVSRRFEAASLRSTLRRCGVDPYYTFAPKGKEETASYRVPLARILQEQKEEARLMPGLRRADEPVYNVPGLGKNYLRAMQHRDLVTVTPDGCRVYEFHPWEKNVTDQETYLATDVSILDYLKRLESLGENFEEYASIWYYF